MKMNWQLKQLFKTVCPDCRAADIKVQETQPNLEAVIDALKCYDLYFGLG